VFSKLTKCQYRVCLQHWDIISVGRSFNAFPERRCNVQLCYQLIPSRGMSLLLPRDGKPQTKKAGERLGPR
jgi:hypothetical protein